MKKNQIKNIRMGFSLFVFILILLAFFGQKEILPFLSIVLFKVQFVPALIHFVSGTGIIFVFILLMTICFGRVYCSFLCPLGIFQDIVIRLSSRMGLKKRQTLNPYWTYVQYTVLILTIVTVIFGSFFMIHLFDPFAIFGKIAGHLIKWLMIFFNNILVEFLEFFDIYWVSIKRPSIIPFQILIITLSFCVAIVLFSVFRARMYCNSFCPVGLILGMVSRFSFFKFSIEKNKCKHCRLCESVCKSGCIDLDRCVVNPSHCVGCFNCLTVCKEDLISYTHLTQKNYGPVSALFRRRFLLDSITFGSAVISVFIPFRLEGKESVSEKLPIMPPGSISFDHFTQSCTACHLCISTCPTQVIKPTFTGYGLSGLMIPELRFINAHCDFDCNVCGSSCPTGAIESLSFKEKQQVQIGTASLNKKLCVVHVKKKHCGACGEACPTLAIQPIDNKKIIFPDINTDFCIGCGACESACPTNPKAIVVSSNRVHKKANIYNPVQALELKADRKTEDFPF